MADGYATPVGYTPGYASAPGYTTGLDHPAALRPPPGPRSLRGLGILTALLLTCQGAVAAAGAGIAAWGVLSWSKLSGAPADLQLPPDIAGVALLRLCWPLTLVTGVAFVAWLYVAASNAYRSGAVLRRSPGWAIAGWFVPVMSYWGPKQMLDDVWRASMPGIPPGIDLRHVRKPPLVAAWWATYLLAATLPGIGAVHYAYSVLGRETWRALRTGTAPEVTVDVARTHETLFLWALWSAVLLSVASGLAAYAVVRVTAWQQERMAAELP
jgi:hypothetical protein